MKQSFQVLRCVLAVWLAIMAAAGCASPVARPPDRQQVTARLDAALDNASGGTGGDATRNAFLLVDAPTVSFLYAGARGLGRVDTGEPATVAHQFNIASVAKSMTAVLIYQLAEEGAFGEPGVEATLGSLDVLPPEVLTTLHQIEETSYGDRITLHHLLTHTSGLRDVYFDGIDNPVSLLPGTATGASPESLVGMAALDPHKGLTPLVRCTLESTPPGCDPDDYLFRRHWAAWDYAAWQADPTDRMAGLLNFYLAGMNRHALWPPGEGFHYSDTNYILLGIVIEAVTGNSLHHELRTRIFDRVGMDHTYLEAANDPPAGRYQGELAEVWAWGEPAISGGVDFSFDWGGGGIVSTLHDLRLFTRALVAGDLFREHETRDLMLAVPPDIRGLSYASGLIVFPTRQGPVYYMLGSNGTWVEYYPPLDLVMIGTVNDFSNLPGQFLLHGEVYRVLSDHGLRTPMATVTGFPMLVNTIALALFLALTVAWLIVIIRERISNQAAPAVLRQARWLVGGVFLANFLVLAVVGRTVADNPFQVLFGFTPQVRSTFVITALVLLPVLVWMVWLSIQAGREEGHSLERWLLIGTGTAILAYGLSLAGLGL